MHHPLVIPSFGIGPDHTSTKPEASGEREQAHQTGRSWTRSKRISLGCLDWKSTDATRNRSPGARSCHKIESSKTRINHSKSQTAMLQNEDVVCDNSRSEIQQNSPMYRSARPKFSTSGADALLRRLRIRSFTKGKSKTDDDLKAICCTSSLLARSASTPRSLTFLPSGEQWRCSIHSDYPISSLPLQSEITGHSVLSLKSAPEMVRSGELMTDARGVQDSGRKSTGMMERLERNSWQRSTHILSLCKTHRSSEFINTCDDFRVPCGDVSFVACHCTPTADQCSLTHSAGCTPSAGRTCACKDTRKRSATLLLGPNSEADIGFPTATGAQKHTFSPYIKCSATPQISCSVCSQNDMPRVSTLANSSVHSIGTMNSQVHEPAYVRRPIVPPPQLFAPFQRIQHTVDRIQHDNWNRDAIHSVNTGAIFAHSSDGIQVGSSALESVTVCDFQSRPVLSHSNPLADYTDDSITGPSALRFWLQSDGSCSTTPQQLRSSHRLAVDSNVFDVQTTSTLTASMDKETARLVTRPDSLLSASSSFTVNSSISDSVHNSSSSHDSALGGTPVRIQSQTPQPKGTSSSTLDPSAVDRRNQPADLPSCARSPRLTYRTQAHFDPVQCKTNQLPPTPRKATWWCRDSAEGPTDGSGYRQRNQRERKKSVYVNAALHPVPEPQTGKRENGSTVGRLSPPTAWAQLLPYRVSTVPQNLSERLKKSETLPNDVWIQARRPDETGERQNHSNFGQAYTKDRNHVDASRSPPPRPPIRTTSQKRIRPTHPSVYVNADFSALRSIEASNMYKPCVETESANHRQTQLGKVDSLGLVDMCEQVDRNSVLYRYSQLYSLPFSPKASISSKSAMLQQSSLPSTNVDMITGLSSLHFERLNLAN